MYSATTERGVYSRPWVKLPLHRKGMVHRDQTAVACGYSNTSLVSSVNDLNCCCLFSSSILFIIGFVVFFVLLFLQLRKPLYPIITTLTTTLLFDGKAGRKS